MVTQYAKRCHIKYKGVMATNEQGGSMLNKMIIATRMQGGTMSQEMSYEV